jgi:hypothetical protein
VLKRPNSRECILETTARFLALPVPCVPGPRENARGTGDEDGAIAKKRAGFLKALSHHRV